jgi:serine/threonine protein kinase
MPTALDELRACRLVPDGLLAELARDPQLATASRPVLAAELRRRGWLTGYQARIVACGRLDRLRVGPYLLVDRLGEGGMGRVYKAWDGRLGRFVALKVIRPQFLAHPLAAGRFLREMQAVARLDHPNLVRALDADLAAGSAYLALEFVEGSDLQRVVAVHGPLAPGRAAQVVRQAALGLGHAHAAGIVHRDLKPSNLLVTPEGTVKVTDFGLARFIEAEVTLTETGLALGTPDYMSPEQANDSKRVDHRSDLYSLGCTLYFLLMGSVPFPEESPAAKLAAHQSAEPVPVESIRGDVPPELRSILRRLLAKDPGQRFASAAELAATLGTLHFPDESLTSSASEVSVEAPTVAAASIAYRHRSVPTAGAVWWLVGAVAVGAAVAGWVVAAWWR